MTAAIGAFNNSQEHGRRVVVVGLLSRTFWPCLIETTIGKTPHFLVSPHSFHSTSSSLLWNVTASSRCWMKSANHGHHLAPRSHTGRGVVAFNFLDLFSALAGPSRLTAQLSISGNDMMLQLVITAANTLLSRWCQHTERVSEWATDNQSITCDTVHRSKLSRVIEFLQRN